MPNARIAGCLMAVTLAVFTGTARAADAAVDTNAAQSPAEKEMSDLDARVTKLEGTNMGAEPGSLDVYWKDGLNFKSGNFAGKLGGRIQFDLFSAPSVDKDVEDKFGDSGFKAGDEFRRVRLYTSGEITGSLKTFYKLEVDFANPTTDTYYKWNPDTLTNDKTTASTGKLGTAFKSVYVGVKDIPVLGAVQIGSMQEPFSLEDLTSDNYITFIERGLPFAFVPDYNVGLMFSNNCADQMVTYAAGVFRDTPDTGFDQGGNYNVTGRVTASPVYLNKGEEVVHVGVSASHRNPNGDTLSYNSKPEAHMAPTFVDTGSFTADGVDLYDGELAGVYGPVYAQGEYIQANVDSSAKGNPAVNGYYAYAGAFLTGETRNYNRAAGIFDHIHPKKNLGHDGGIGAVEVAARYSHLDLNDAGLSGGELSDTTLGVNWYLNPNVRVMWNYVFADLQSVGRADICEMRFQVDF